MCDIKRINRLKKTSRAFTDKLNTINRLDTYSKDFVSGTGLTFSDMQEKIDKISSCASIIELKESFQEHGNTFDQVLSVSAANFCKQHVICPICADRSQSRRRARYNEPIKQQAELVKQGKRYAYFITYTVNDGEDLAERLEHLKESKKSFRKMGQKRKNKRSRGEAGKYKSAISTIEIKRGSNSNLWHVHSHDLVFTDKPLDFIVYDQTEKNRLKDRYGKNIPRDQLNNIAKNKVVFNGELVAASKMSMEWLNATGGDSINLSVESLQHVPKSAKGAKKRLYQKMSFEDSICYQAREILKYFTKPGDNLAEDAFLIISDTYNKRMTATYGEFRGLPGDDYMDAAAEDQNTFVLVWDAKEKKYGEPIPGKIRDFVEDPDQEHETRSAIGKILGIYRRKRKEILSRRDILGDDLFRALDETKSSFRRGVNVLWSIYHQAKNVQNNVDLARCDKYNAVLALAGIFLPGSDRRETYCSAFS